MPFDSISLVSHPLTARSRVTNGKQFDGVDGRSANARRFRDLVDAFSRDLGGMSQLTEADRSLVRQAATLTVRSEQLQAAIVRGEPVDPDELIRLTNTARRTLAGIRRKEQPKETISDYLARKQGAVA